MTDNPASNRLTPILWFVAAALAFIAFGIRFTSDRELNYAVAAGGAFCLVMGIGTWRRQRRPRS